ncbi:MAG: allantoinase PuuE [Acidobacteriota bacterium]|nr:allantoinase PuuE [Acidobacteriota bacterium]
MPPSAPPSSAGYPRDLAGYGPRPPQPAWPGDARLAVSFVINWEEGAEQSVLHGDDTSEVGVSDALGLAAVADRQMTVESMFEYGSRAGVWRLADLFDRYRVPVTVFAAGQAVERYPDPVRHLHAAGHEICPHGWRWVDYQHVPADVETDHIRRAVAAVEAVTGTRPLGWYTGRTSPRTRALVVAEGGFLYDSDAYNDDLPYWTRVGDRDHLVVPYSFDSNDMRFATTPGFTRPDDFSAHLIDTFDQLYAEGETAPKMMSVGLHCRLAGRPARTLALRRFVEHVLAHDAVWVARRVDIARHWAATHPPALPGTSTHRSSPGPAIGAA